MRTKIKFTTILIVANFLSVCCCYAQRNDIKDSTLLNLNAHRIEYSENLIPFIDKIKEFKTDPKKTITIVQIGDSHVQGAIFPGALRDTLQSIYGDAGRGLVFPYQVAGTNGDSYVRFKSGNRFASIRNVKSDGSDDIGLSGIYLNTKDPEFILEMDLKYPTTHLNSIALLSDHPENLQITTVKPKRKVELKSPQISAVNRSSATTKYSYYKVKKGDNLGKISKKNNTTISQLQKWNNLRGVAIQINQRLIVGETIIPIEPEIKATDLPEEVLDSNITNLTEPEIEEESFDIFNSVPSLISTDQITYTTPKNESTFYISAASKQDHYTIDGLILKNNKPGILFHSIGVNGAQLVDYTKFNRFFEQLAFLQPDLIIISLGTNESFSNTLTLEEFKQMLLSFNEKLQGNGILAPVLATSAPPSYKNGKVNDTATMLSYELKSYANSLKWSFYDLHSVTGTSSNMNTWYNRKLTARDKVHFNASGYTLLGKLIGAALINTIEKSE